MGWREWYLFKRIIQSKKCLFDLVSECVNTEFVVHKRTQMEILVQIWVNNKKITRKAH